MHDRWLPVTTAARLAGVNRYTLARWMRQGLVPARRLPSGRLRVRMASLWTHADQTSGPCYSGREALARVDACTQAELRRLSKSDSPTLRAVARWRLATRQARPMTAEVP